MTEPLTIKLKTLTPLWTGRSKYLRGQNYD